jgi:hypothetical protein
VELFSSEKRSKQFNGFSGFGIPGKGTVGSRRIFISDIPKIDCMASSGRIGGVIS